MIEIIVYIWTATKKQVKLKHTEKYKRYINILLPYYFTHSFVQIAF